MTQTLVWITGASAGLGRALVETIPYDDAVVVDVSRRGGVPGTEHLGADLADPSGWVAVEADLRGRLADASLQRAVFIHCAGTLEPMGFAAEVDAEGYRRQVLLNAAAPQVLGHAFLSAGRRSSAALTFVQISSGAASTPYEGWSAYCAGKAAGDMWVRTAGAEQARRGGTRVLAIAPGVLDTAMQAEIRSHDADEFPAIAKFRDLHASGRLVDPADAAAGIWRVLERDDVATGSVLDLRDLEG